jgi:hypothetical protein
MITCGDCIYRDPTRKICLLNLSYAAFVLPEQPANGCHGYQDAERAVGEQQAQGQVRGPGAYELWRDAVRGVKP